MFRHRTDDVVKEKLNAIVGATGDGVASKWLGHVPSPPVPATGSSEYLTPEAQARMEIDRQLKACGWVVQDYKYAAVAAAQGVAVREVPTEAGPADYVLFVDAQAMGVIEAKKAGSTLTGVEPQTGKYRTAYPDELPAFTVDGALPFGYESTGSETRFTCGLDPIAASRRVFSFHRPETLAHWVDEHVRLGGFATLRAGLQLLPQLEPDAPGLWPAQAEAIRNLEESLLETDFPLARTRRRSDPIASARHWT